MTRWVVTWYSFGYIARMFEYTVRIFELYCTDILNVSRFLYDFSSIPRKLYTIFQPTFFPIKGYQDILFKLLTLSTNSVTKKITVIRIVYFYNSGSIFATKYFVTVCTQSKKLYVNTYPGITRSGKTVGLKMVYNFLGKDEKHGETSTYFRLKIHCGKEVGHFPCSVSKLKHVTTQPEWAPQQMFSLLPVSITLKVFREKCE